MQGETVYVDLVSADPDSCLLPVNFNSEAALSLVVSPLRENRLHLAAGHVTGTAQQVRVWRPAAGRGVTESRVMTETEPVCLLYFTLPSPTTAIAREVIEELMMSRTATKKTVEVRLSDVAEMMCHEWQLLANQLHVTDDDLNHIRAHYHYPSEQVSHRATKHTASNGHHLHSDDKLTTAIRRQSFMMNTWYLLLSKIW